MKKIKPKSVEVDKKKNRWFIYDEFTPFKEYLRHKNKEMIRKIIKKFNDGEYEIGTNK